MVVKAEKSCNLLSVSQRTRKAGGIIHSDSEDLRMGPMV